MDVHPKWRHWLTLLLVVEKIIQHIVVTVAFYTDWQQIGATVVVNPTLLMVAGGFLALLFMLALWAIVTRQRWALDLVIALALIDIVGKFYAQGKIAILITFSFLVACVLLFLAVSARRSWITATRHNA